MHYLKITNIENHEKIFELSYLEISKYLDFKMNY